MQSPSSTADKKRKDRTPEEGSKVIYLRALTAALENREKTSPQSENESETPRSGSPSVETELDGNAELTCCSFSEETAPVCVQSEEHTHARFVFLDTEEEGRVRLMRLQTTDNIWKSQRLHISSSEKMHLGDVMS